MNILFVNHNDFSSNSAIHIFHLANKLIDLGVDCGVCVPRSKKTINLIGTAKFKVYDYGDFNKRNILFRDGFGPDLIHAWTPREIVRKFTQKLQRHYGVPYVVHLEDNEEAILKSKYKTDMTRWRSLPLNIVDKVIDHNFTHPLKYIDFLEEASGVTVIIDKLLEFKPENVSGEVIWPGYDDELYQPRPVNIELKLKLGIPEKSFVVVYHGNVHHSNQKEVYSLYLAVAILNRKGIPVKLVRTGRNYVKVYNDVLNAYKDCFVELDFVDRKKLPDILSLSNAFVQPGTADEFNDYRFPSKLPEFFAMGKPVILPYTNIGRYIIDGHHGILLKYGDALEIAEKLEFIFHNEEIGKLIGCNGKKFAKEHFNWDKSAKKLKNYYINVLEHSK